MTIAALFQMRRNVGHREYFNAIDSNALQERNAFWLSWKMRDLYVCRRGRDGH